MSSTPCEWPCAVSTTRTSTCAATSAATRSGVLADANGGATRSRPSESLQALGI